MAKNLLSAEPCCLPHTPPPSLDSQFLAGASLSEGVSGKAPLETDRHDYKADRYISRSVSDEAKQKGE